MGLGAALDYLNRIGIENVARYEHELLEYGMHVLRAIPGVRLIGTAPDKTSVLSFVLAGHSTRMWQSLERRRHCGPFRPPLRAAHPAPVWPGSHGPAVAGVLQYLRRNRPLGGRGQTLAMFKNAFQRLTEHGAGELPRFRKLWTISRASNQF